MLRLRQGCGILRWNAKKRRIIEIEQNHNGSLLIETAQAAAQNTLAAARAEIVLLDRNELIRWTGEDVLIDSAYSKLDVAGKMIDDEQFAESEKTVAASLNELRRIAKKAEENKVASEQRYALAEVIMNALYEQGYDVPTYHYMQKRQDGSEIEFSDLRIFAKSPGGNSDMGMKINLEGVAELDDLGPGVCVETLENLQKGVSGDLDFEVRNWEEIKKKYGGKVPDTIRQTTTTKVTTKVTTRGN